MSLPGAVVKTKNRSLSISQKMKTAKFRLEHMKMMHCALDIVHLPGRFMIVVLHSVLNYQGFFALIKSNVTTFVFTSLFDFILVYTVRKLLPSPPSNP